MVRASLSSSSSSSSLPSPPRPGGRASFLSAFAVVAAVLGFGVSPFPLVARAFAPAPPPRRRRLRLRPRAGRGPAVAGRALDGLLLGGVLFRHPRLDSRPRRWLASSGGGGEDPSPTLPPPTVLCVGEALWDSLPSGLYLGGAPANVAVHLASLFASGASDASDISSADAPTVAMAACVGSDALGREAIRRLSLRGVRDDYVQVHPDWETGVATTVLDENGDATPEFNTPAAWDGLRLDAKVASLLEADGGGEPAPSTRAFVMGTIAARLGDEHGAASAATLRGVRNGARDGTVVLDVNLRAPWYDAETVLGLARGDVEGKALALLKVNESELQVLERWCSLEKNDSLESAGSLSGPALERRMEELARSLNARRVCVTRGSDGAALLCRGSKVSSIDSESNDNNVVFLEHPGFGDSASKGTDSDTVGAGDAFLASLVASLLVNREAPASALERACALGGYVAGCRGATPEHGDALEELRRVFASH
ncbi:hypothetical protein ACHAWF_001399 [Thalassiosira exigua]